MRGGQVPALLAVMPSTVMFRRAQGWPAVGTSTGNGPSVVPAQAIGAPILGRGDDPSARDQPTDAERAPSTPLDAYRPFSPLWTVPDRVGRIRSYTRMAFTVSGRLAAVNGALRSAETSPTNILERANHWLGQRARPVPGARTVG
jgi:hypothetical protein